MGFVLEVECCLELGCFDCDVGVFLMKECFVVCCVDVFV